MNTKDKIRVYLDYKGKKSYWFEKNAGLSNGTLKSGNDFRADKLKQIRDNFLDLNMNWLIYDEGEMILKEETSPMIANESRVHYENSCKNCDHLEAMLKAKEEIIESKEQHIASLKHQLGINGGKNKSKAS